jgi:beta-hydroxylase
MLAALAAFLVFLFIFGSMLYVYRFRGSVRYDSFNQYLRKGWLIFNPLNCVLYLFTQARARQPILDLDRFRELDVIRDNWETIRREAVDLYRRQYFETTKNPDSQAYYDVGFRTFYKYGWSKFYLKWYGCTHDSARRLCPETVAILESVPSVNGAMFSVLPVGSKLTRHADPFACSLRYHLGLETPESDACYIDIDGRAYSWRNGEALLFDETYLHYARNDAGQYRLILMCDIERPMHFIGSAVNFLYKGLMRLTVVPNETGDERGLANRIFAGIAPVLARTRRLKQTNRNRYRAIKYSVNLTLGLIFCALLAGPILLLF